MIVQKYVTDLFLVEWRKFDFRVWALIDHNNNLFWFKFDLLTTCMNNVERGTCACRVSRST